MTTSTVQNSASVRILLGTMGELPTVPLDSWHWLLAGVGAHSLVEGCFVVYEASVFLALKDGSGREYGSRLP